MKLNDEQKSRLHDLFHDMANGHIGDLIWIEMEAIEMIEAFIAYYIKKERKINIEDCPNCCEFSFEYNEEERQGYCSNCNYVEN